MLSSVQFRLTGARLSPGTVTSIRVITCISSSRPVARSYTNSTKRADPHCEEAWLPSRASLHLQTNTPGAPACNLYPPPALVVCSRERDRDARKQAGSAPWTDAVV